MTKKPLRHRRAGAALRLLWAAVDASEAPGAAELMRFHRREQMKKAAGHLPLDPDA